MSRVARGFHRLGIVIAVPIAGAAVAIATLAYQERRADVAAFESSAAQRQSATGKKIFEFRDDKGAIFQVEAPDQKSAAAGFERFKKSAPTALPPPPGFVVDIEPGPWAGYPRATPNPFSDLIPEAPKSFMQYFATSLLTLAVALATYLGIRSIGWVIEGFLRNPNETS